MVISRTDCIGPRWSTAIIAATHLLYGPVRPWLSRAVIPCSGLPWKSCRPERKRGGGVSRRAGARASVSRASRSRERQSHTRTTRDQWPGHLVPDDGRVFGVPHDLLQRLAGALVLHLPLRDGGGRGSRASRARHAEDRTGQETRAVTRVRMHVARRSCRRFRPCSSSGRPRSFELSLGAKGDRGAIMRPCPPASTRLTTASQAAARCLEHPPRLVFKACRTPSRTVRYTLPTSDDTRTGSL